MIVYRWYDHRSVGRDPVLDGLNEIADKFDALKINGDSSDLADNTLAFIHPGNDVGASYDNWMHSVNAGQNRYIVFVSSQPWPSSSNSNSNTRIYHITQPLPVIAKYLSENPVKVESFIKSCEDCTPDWSVFEPAVYPENLVAWYLAEIAKQQSVEINDTNLLQEIKKKAANEYQDLAKAHSHHEDFNSAGIKALFKEMAKSL